MKGRWVKRTGGAPPPYALYRLSCLRDWIDSQGLGSVVVSRDKGRRREAIRNIHAPPNDNALRTAWNQNVPKRFEISVAGKSGKDEEKPIHSWNKETKFREYGSRD